MRSVEEQVNWILENVATAPALELPLLDAQGCLLAADIVAEVNLPPWDNSSMDGYAVRLSDVLGASREFPAELRVIDDIAAGYLPARPISAGSCSRIMTGAPVPEGTEAIIPVEETDAGTSRVKVYTQPTDGQFIRALGSDVRAGETLLTAGTELGPAQLGLLAAVGRNRVPARPRPRVVVISTGSELVDPGSPLRPGAIFESNSYMLAAAARDAGGVPYRVGLVHDDEDKVLATIEEQLGRADLLITSGGVSAGAYDVVKGVLSKLGTVEFGGVKMNPGKPQGFGRVGGVPIFTLPGNPVSSYVSFEVFVRPAIRRMRGLTPERRPLIRATASEPMKSPWGKTQFMRGILGPPRPYGPPHVRPIGGASSHLIGDLALANCFMVIGEDVDEIRIGDQIDVMPLDRDPS